MKNGLYIILAVGMVLLSACTATIYGVPEERWQLMSETERVAAMDAYRERQIVLQQAQAERARQRAVAEEQARQLHVEEQRHLQQRVAATYRGQGVYGDLLQVTVSEGLIKFSGKHRPYHPLTFRIAQGETKDLMLVSDKGRRQKLRVSYSEGSLVIDSRGAKYHQAARFTYAPQWAGGLSFTDIHTKGDAELRGVTVSVDVLGTRPRHPLQPQVVVIQQPPPPPSQPQVVIVQQPPGPRQPDVIITELSGKDEAGRRRGHDSAPKTQPPQPVSAGQPRNVEAPTVVTAPASPESRVTGDSPPQNRGEQASPNHKPWHATERASREPSSDRRHDSEKRIVAVAERPPQRVLVKFHKGQVKIKGKHQPFSPFDITVVEGHSQRITLRTKTGSVEVTLSYLQGELTVDDGSSPAGNPNGKIKLGYEQGWATGRAYRLDPPGSLRLKNLELEVQAVRTS